MSEPAKPSSLTRRDDTDIQGLKKALADGATVVDVRTQAEWDAGHVPGAIHVPLDQLSPEHDAVKDLPKDEPIYFVCQSGGRSARAADRMAAAGFASVNVQGGTGAWKAAGNPVE